MTLKEQFVEYYDTLMTLELAVHMAEREKRPVNRTICNSWNEMNKRVQHPQNRAIFTGICKQTFPLGALRMLRRQLDSIADQPARKGGE